MSNEVDKSVESTLEDRTKQYGSFADVAEVSQELHKLASSYPGYDKMTNSMKMAVHMIFNKLGREIVGGAKKVDTWLDIAGYASGVVDSIRGYGPTVVGKPAKPKVNNLTSQEAAYWLSRKDNDNPVGTLHSHAEISAVFTDAPWKQGDDKQYDHSGPNRREPLTITPPSSPNPFANQDLYDNYSVQGCWEHPDNDRRNRGPECSGEDEFNAYTAWCKSPKYRRHDDKPRPDRRLRAHDRRVALTDTGGTDHWLKPERRKTMYDRREKNVTTAV